jgi:GNAT superfamily N-acetyltransferase
MYKLKKLELPEQWSSLHEIRREVLFDSGEFHHPYDENHPDDRMDGNTPYLLYSDDHPVGVVRLDQRGTLGIIRLVGIRSAFQRRGLGRVLSTLVDGQAIVSGITQLRVNARTDALGFYEKTGWHRAIWDAIELANSDGRCVQMIKDISAV